MLAMSNESCQQMAMCYTMQGAMDGYWGFDDSMFHMATTPTNGTVLHSKVSDSQSSRRRRKESTKVCPTSEDASISGGKCTTVMLRNLPNNYNRDTLLSMLDDQGFSGMYDFVYLPIDFKTQACMGYAFVNLVSPEIVEKFWAAFDGFSNWVLPSKKVCGVTWSGPHQGREAHIERYRNSPVMHSMVPESFKPVLFEDGKRVEFPPPTKQPRAPRARNYGNQSSGNRTWQHSGVVTSGAWGDTGMNYDRSFRELAMGDLFV